MMHRSKILDGKYEIISEIKKGGFGIVYYGFDRNLGKAVAIKEIAPELLAEAKYIDMFQAEARNAAKLNHHNIVHIFDLLKTPDGHFYIIMEYVDGVDLYKIIKQSSRQDKKLAVNLATYIIGEVCKALEYAHNRKDLITGEPLNLIHQDISPSNIMVSMKGDVKIIDFGIARVRLEQKTNTPNLVLQGKLPYMSPEQLNAHGMIDGRSDIFSLGVVFYELITGVRSFQGATEEETIRNIQNGKLKLEPLQSLKVPAVLQHIIARAMHPEIDQRYQNANQMYLDLAQYLMVASKTIELSNELGNYVKGLFQAPDETTAYEGRKIEISTAPAPVTENANEILADFSADETLALAEPDIFAENLAQELQLSTPKPEPVRPDFISEVMDLTSMPAVTSIETSTAETPPENQIPETVEEDWDIRELDETLLATEKMTPGTHPPQEPAPAITAPEKPAPLRIPEPPVPPPPVRTGFAPPMVSRPRGTADEAGEDDVKTIIDVVRLASRSYKKQLLAGVAALGLTIILFLTLDVLFQLTTCGNGIYNWLFPPAIKIVSFPSGAQIYIDNQLLDKRTPVSIQRISPGIHKLKLETPGFSPITRSIKVAEKGETHIEGVEKPGGSDAYVFHFLALINFVSLPSDATVYLNDMRFGEKTPCTVQWEVGKPITVEMEKEGFQRLTGFTFNLLNLAEQDADRRYWRITKQVDTTTTNGVLYSVHGFFRKMVQIQSTPSGANIYLDHETAPIGITGQNNLTPLTFGPHTITVNKAGFLPQKVDITINEVSSSKINLILRRSVRFTARDATTPPNQDLGAKLVQIMSRGRAYPQTDIITPCEVILDAVSYEALFRKTGFRDALVPISPEQKLVTVQMEPMSIAIEIIVTDAVSGKPVPNAQIFYRESTANEKEEKIFDLTDTRGMCTKVIAQGTYIFKVVKDGYFLKQSTHITASTGKNKIRFNLVGQ